MKINESLRENKSIQLKRKVKDWKEAIYLLMKPLVESGAVSENYPDAIIKRTEEIGPFYALAPGFLMPHERGECGALKDAFTFLTLEEPIDFPSGEYAKVLIGFSATDADVHIAETIPQVVKIYEADEELEKMLSFENEEDLLEFIEEALK